MLVLQMYIPVLYKSVILSTSKYNLHVDNIIIIMLINMNLN